MFFSSAARRDEVRELPGREDCWLTDPTLSLEISPQEKVSATLAQRRRAVTAIIRKHWARPYWGNDKFITAASQSEAPLTRPWSIAGRTTDGHKGQSCNCTFISIIACTYSRLYTTRPHGARAAQHRWARDRDVTVLLSCMSCDTLKRKLT